MNIFNIRTFSYKLFGRVVAEQSPDKGLFILGIDIGMAKHLSERFKNYLAWFQMPVLLYTAFISTLNYLPEVLKGRVVEVLLLCTFGFLAFAAFVIYVDLKFIFPSERQFMYKGTPYFEKRFNDMEAMIKDGKKQ